MTIGGGHAGGQLGWIHFGLGSADHPQVRVTWPDGWQSGWLDVGSNQFVVIDRSTGTPTTWTPPAG